MQLFKEKDYRRKRAQAPALLSHNLQNFCHFVPSKGTTRGKEALSFTQ
jgi:hypothetical protein